MSHPVTRYYSSWFPGEQFLTDDITLPDFARERQLIIYKIVAVVSVFIIVLPVLFAAKQVELVEQSSASTDCDAAPSAAAKRGAKKRVNNKSKRVNGKKVVQQAGVSSPLKESPSEQATTTTTVINPIISNLLNLICIIIIFFITFLNDNNLFAARTIIQAPVFTREECQHVINMAHAAAQRNAESAQRDKAALLLQHHDLKDEDITQTQQQHYDNATYSEEQHKLNTLRSIIKEPSGWKKGRHTSYPTTDLNLVTDPFTAEDRAYLAERLNARLAPVVERAFGIARGAIRANDVSFVTCIECITVGKIVAYDTFSHFLTSQRLFIFTSLYYYFIRQIFVVRYDATKGQQQLRRHTDSSHLSFNILLNDGFEGGGTR